MDEQRIADDYRTFAASGDRAALEQVLRASVQPAFAQARRTLGNASDAEDAVQEALLQLVRAAPRYDPAYSFPAWRARLVHAACSRLRQARGRRRRHEAGAAGVAPMTTSEGLGVDVEGVRAAVADLPEADRRAIELVYFAELDHGRAAEALGVRVNALAVRLHRARERLRRLLQRRGIVCTSVAMVGALASNQACAAPPALAASVDGLVAATTWPSTTIGIPLLRKALVAMSQHPIAAALSVAVLATGIALPLASLIAADAPTTAPPPVGQPAPVAWTGPARELLTYRDPRAALTLALDGQALRSLARSTKPSSLLADPRAAAAVDEAMTQLDRWSLPDDERSLLFRSLRDGVGFLFSSRPSPTPRLEESGMRVLIRDGVVVQVSPRPSPAPRHQDRGMQVLIDIPTQIPRLADLAQRERPDRWVAASHRSLVGYRAGDRFFGTDERRFAMIGEDLLAAPGQPPRIEEPRAEDLRSPAWMTFDGRPVIAALASAGGDGDPLALRSLLGEEWRSARPALRIDLTATSGSWRAEGEVTGLPRGLIPILARALGGTAPDSVASPLREVRSDLATLIPPDALAWAACGCEVAAVDALLAPRLSPQDRSWGQGREAWSGDLVAVVRPGAPFPAMSIALGLRPEVAAGTIARLVEITGALPVAPPAGARAAWTRAAGPIQVRIVDRVTRLDITTASDPAAAFGPSRGSALADHLVVHVDLATLARTYLPLAYALAPQQPITLRRAPILRGLAGSIDTIAAQLVAQGRVDLATALPAWAELTPDLDRHIAVLVAAQADPRHPQPGQIRLVIRLDNGYHLIGPGDQADETKPGFARDEIVLLQQTFRPVSTRSIEALDPLALPPPATFSRAWLPPPATVVEHLPDYHLAISSTPDGLRLEERGLPLVASLTVAPLIALLDAARIEEPEDPATAPAEASPAVDF